MQELLIGRKNELKKLDEYLNSNRSEFVAVYGRRRIGKTFLVRRAIAGKSVFQLTGMENISLEEQLMNFYLSLRKFYPLAQKCSNWLEAFGQLECYLESVTSEKKILFFDELPWLDTAKSNFISALEHFWNDWASARQDIKLITCGSAASWMLDNLINNHGGLHNRVTHQMLIEPFSLSECKDYFDTFGFNYGEREIAEYYMVFGGVPFYLSLLNNNESLVQNIDRLIFSATGELRTEKDNLFKSLFKHSEDYVRIVEALSSKGRGLTRNELLAATKLHNNARFSSMLQELENCRFIRQYLPFDNKKRMVSYQLTDPFLHFCYQVQDKCKYQDEHFWSNSLNSPLFNAWCGLAFEILCLNHISQIKGALKIGGVQTAVYSWHTPVSVEKGAQIDLVIDRADHQINLCEMKFSYGEYVINKAEREKLEHRVNSFLSYTKTKSSIILTIITSFGLQKNIHSGIAQKQLSLKDFFYS